MNRLTLFFRYKFKLLLLHTYIHTIITAYLTQKKKKSRSHIQFIHDDVWIYI